MVETLLGIQIIAVLFSLFMLYVAFLHLKKGNINSSEFVFWLIVWTVFIYFTLFPTVLNPVLSKLFIGRTMDFFILLAFMILTFMGFQNHIGVKHLQKTIEKLVSSQAIKNAKK